MATESNLEKLQRLLRQMFQFDCADLDFGIYRIMNHKRDVIERFIEKDLLEAVAEELDRGALAEPVPGGRRAEGGRRADPRDAWRRRPRRRRQPGRRLPRRPARQAIPGPQAKAAGAPGRAGPGGRHLQPPVRLLQPLLRQRRLHLQAPLLPQGEVRHPLQRRGSLPALGQQRPVLRQDRRALHRLPLHVARPDGPFRLQRRRRRAGQRQGRQALLRPAGQRGRLRRQGEGDRHPVRVPAADRAGETSSTARRTSRTPSSPRPWRPFPSS